MNIGTLLKKYRIRQNKSMKEWVGNVMTPSQYSKVERGTSQITTERLLELLDRNGIVASEFFSNNEAGENNYNLEQQLRYRLVNAYYHNSEAEINQVKYMIEKSKLPDDTKQNLSMIVKVCLADVNNDFDSLNSTEKAQIKKEIFEDEDLDKHDIELYCNTMGFYDLDDNIFMVNRIFDKFGTNTDVEIQEIILSILFNLLTICIEENRYDDALPFVRMAEKLPVHYQNLCQHLVLNLDICMIKYYYDPKSDYLNECECLIKAVAYSGLVEYSDELEKFYLKYVRKNNTNN